ncbi:trypsin-like peptidase domain-containing protein [Pseudomonas sp. NFXW11]|uniref:S1 family peptidase n=1 Tax=Pseudomonas sp. NFXW11 TaxID=2819531 RepID=UPI003CED1D3D
MNEFITKSTARIDSYNGEQHIGSGTGFFCILAQKGEKQVIGLVTNKHVIAGTDNIKVLLTVKKGEIIQHQTIGIKLNNPGTIFHSNRDIDACAINISHIFTIFQTQGFGLQHAVITHEIIANEELFNQILPLEEITMIGYPIGLMDTYNNGAVARRGVIASNPAHNYENRPEFLIDMACMPGSSGSPVFLANTGSYSTKNNTVIMGTRLHLLGFLWGGPERKVTGEIVAIPAPMNTKPIAVTHIPINLGFVIKATQLKDIFDQASRSI